MTSRPFSSWYFSNFSCGTSSDAGLAPGGLVPVCAVALAGDTAGSRRLIQELQQRSDPPYGNHPAAVAALHGMLGDSDRAFALLDQAYAERDWMLRDVKVSPLWDSLRKDPRFPKLLQQMHLD